MKRLLAIGLILLLLPGCTLFGFGTNTKTAIDTPKQVKTNVTKLKELKVPVQSSNAQEYNRAALAMTREKVQSADSISTEQPVKSELKDAQTLIDALQRSLGVPTAKITATVENIKNTIIKMDRENLLLKTERDVFSQQIDEQNKIIARLKGVIETKIEAEQSLFDKAKMWFWIAVVLSIIIAVALPGGMIIVKRFWSKLAEMGAAAAQATYNAAAELSSAVSKYMESSQAEEEKKKLSAALNSMSEEAKAYWRKARKGDNPVIDLMAKLPPEVATKINGFVNNS